MKHAPAHQKAPHHNLHTSAQFAAAGPDGVALAPPAYGLESADRAQTEIAPQPDREQPLGASIQMKAELSAAGGEAGPGPENNTGLPDALKAGVESLSGLALDDVRVHYNSSRPAALQALAYTQGADIHIGPGQERHLPHEAWHVVQQKQGRVKPTMQMKNASINDDHGLEKEADRMGSESLQTRHARSTFPGQAETNSKIIQRKVGFEFEVPEWRVINQWPGEYLPGIRLTKNKRLVDGAGWYLQTDLLGVGGVDPEFVVKPVDETAAGLAQLNAAMLSLTAFGAALVAAPAGPILVRQLQGAKFLAKTTSIDRQGVPLLGDPQVTAGIHFDRVLNLLSDLGNLVPAVGGMGFGAGNLATGDLAQGPEAAFSLHSVSQQAQALTGAPNFRTQKYVGLVALVAHQVYRGQVVPPQYAKQLASVMSRSAIPSALQSTQEVQLGLVTAAQWRADVLIAANDLALARFAPAGAGPLIVAWAGVIHVPTIAQYLNGLYAGHDVLADMDTSMGKMGQERVGPAQNNWLDWLGFDTRDKGLIVELRDVRQDIPLAQWAPFTVAIFNYIQAMNDINAAPAAYAGVPGFGPGGAVPPGVPAPAIPAPVGVRQKLQRVGQFLRSFF